MEKCKNCESFIRENDKYCRNCGHRLRNNFYIIISNIFTILLVVAILFLIALIVTAICIK